MYNTHILCVIKAALLVSRILASKYSGLLSQEDILLAMNPAHGKFLRIVLCNLAE